MKKLFIRFYLFIVVCLISLAWLVETLWFTNQETQNLASHSQIALARSIKSQLWLDAQLPHLQAQANKLSQYLATPIKILPSQQIALPVEATQTLNQGQALVLFDAHDQAIIYQKLDTSSSQQRKAELLLVIGPLKPDPISNSSTPLQMYLIFYLCLGLLIALWLWPLWRDLKNLQAQCEYLGRQENQQVQEQNIKPSSAIYPIAQTIEQMANRIHSLLQTQKEMSSAVSHELRTPLARTKFALAMVPENCAPQAQAIGEDINEMENIIEQLLDFARLEADGPKLSKEPVDLISLLHNQVQQLQELSSKQLDFTPNNSELYYHCDGFYLERIISNLLSNANRYALSNIRATIEQNKDTLTIHVDDDGPGIPESEMQHIFKPFCRLDKSRGKATGGVGLGLSIVQRLVEWHQGHCTVSRSPLGGARFSVHFPFSPNKK